VIVICSGSMKKCSTAPTPQPTSVSAFAQTEAPTHGNLPAKSSATNEKSLAVKLQGF
jgi:hypothetical protein